MKLHHTRYYWLLVALAVAAFLFTLGEAHGQGSGAAAAFEGRPALAGAQAGQGAQAGPPQGGIGVQGSELAERGLRPGRPSGLDDVRRARHQRHQDLEIAAAAATELGQRKDVEPARDRSLAKDERSSVTKGKRAVKRTISRARHGVSQIDSAQQAAAAR